MPTRGEKSWNRTLGSAPLKVIAGSHSGRIGLAVIDAPSALSWL